MLRGARPLRALALGLVCGFVYFGATLYWVRLFGELGWSSLSLASAAYVVLFALLAPVLWRSERPILSCLGLAALWTATEYLRSMWPLGGFTWGGLGYTQVDNGFLLPLASVTGVWGISFVIVLVNALAVTALERLGSAPNARRWIAVAPLAAALAVVLAPGLIHIPDATGRAVDVAVVQGNDFETPLADLEQQRLLIERQEARLHRTRLSAGPPGPPDLVVWPEDAVDIDPLRDPRSRAIVTGAIRAVGSPTLVGAITEDSQGRAYNQGLLYDGSGGLIGRYTKVHLVPFGEFVPWRRLLGWISALRQIPRDLTPGNTLRTLEVGGVRFGDVICYENTFPSLDRRVVAMGAGFLVVQTNNASYGRTAASRQHLDMSRMRAVENARWVVHAAVSGISAFVDPAGGVHQPTGLFQLAVDRQAVRMSSARTIYNRVGDALPWISIGGVVLLLVFPRRSRTARVPEGLPSSARGLVILPTFNERATIDEVVTRVLAREPRVDVLVVDDGSPDGTAEAVRRLSEREPRVRLVERASKGGLASAYLTGFRRAIEDGYDLAIEMDADLSHEPEELPSLIDAARRFDLVVGSRYVPGGSVTNWGFARRALSRAGNRYTRIVLGLPVADSTSGYRVYRADLVRRVLSEGIRSEGYGFQIELAYLAWREGYAVGEVPITFRERQHGQSKISRRIVVEALAHVTAWGLKDRLRVPSGFRKDHLIVDVTRQGEVRREKTGVFPGGQPPRP